MSDSTLRLAGLPDRFYKFTVTIESGRSHFEHCWAQNESAARKTIKDRLARLGHITFSLQSNGIANLF